jgi:outer membrane lipoprotein-sorting protein
MRRRTVRGWVVVWLAFCRRFHSSSPFHMLGVAYTANHLPSMKKALNHCREYCSTQQSEIMYTFVTLFLLCFVPAIAQAESPPLSPATALVQEAIEYWREGSSHAVASMTVHRPDWERTMKFTSWTKGNDFSLIQFIAPPKDAGSASLKRGNEMWSYSPKIRRVIKIPSSMMAQSWMGSDFSYNDLARDDDIIEYYTTVSSLMKS